MTRMFPAVFQYGNKCLLPNTDLSFVIIHVPTTLGKAWGG